MWGSSRSRGEGILGDVEPLADGAEEFSAAPWRCACASIRAVVAVSTGDARGWLCVFCFFFFVPLLVESALRLEGRERERERRERVRGIVCGRNKVCACAHAHDLWIQWCIRVEYSSPSPIYYSQPSKKGTRSQDIVYMLTYMMYIEQDS